jgi:hypothetical protein
VRLLAFVVSTAIAAGAADDPPGPLTRSLEDQANAIWSDLPEDSADARVTRLAGTSAECANAALRAARRAVSRAGGGRLALRDLSRSTPAVQPISDPDCGTAAAVYDLRALPDRPGRLSLHMLVEGSCGCSGPDTTRRRFHIEGLAELEPGIVEKGGVQRWRAKEPRYAVLGDCAPCGGKGRIASASQGPCDQACGPLEEGLAGWRQDVFQATAKLEELGRQATAIELDLGTQRRELDAAQATRRKPRSLLERITALQEKVKAGQAELERVTRASKDVQQAVSALQRIVEDTRAAGAACQSQCAARQQQADRAPKPSSGSPGAAGAGAAAGGGLGKGAIIAGGAVLAGGGAALALSQGGDGAPPSFAGTWAGTRTTVTFVDPQSPSRCTRVFDETWTISQNGPELNAAVTATAQGCGAPPCGACQVFSFPRTHPGSAEGELARFYVFPELQTPSCVLVMRLQGDTLSGSMPGCDTGGAVPLSDTVTLRRTGR